MPQIAQLAATYSSQVFWMLVVFAVIFFGIGRAMLPKVQSTIEGREGRIAGDLAAAHAARAAADADEAGYHARLAEARAVGQKASADAKATAVAEAEARVKAADAVAAGRVAEAEQRLRAQTADAMAAIEDVAVEAAQDIVARVSGLTVGRDQAAGAVRAALAPARN